MTKFVGSDGRPVIGSHSPPMSARMTELPGFGASNGTWESFVIYCADPSKTSGLSDRRSTHPEWPNIPSNIIEAHPLAPSIRYNTFVVLQSLQTGMVSPVLIIRRIGDDTEVSGQDGTVDDPASLSPDGERSGDLVSQLQKVAFELYSPTTLDRLTRDSRYGGLWMSCEQDTAIERLIMEERRWAPMPVSTHRSGSSGSRSNSVPNTPLQRPTQLSMTPHTSTVPLPSTDSSPMSHSSSEYFGPSSRKTSSTTLPSLKSPVGYDTALPSTDGGPVRRQRTGSIGKGPLARPMHKKRASADNSANSSFEHLHMATMGPPDLSMQPFWTMKLTESCIWSVVRI